ncbi:unnamed protein product [Moneuplotes crassus]|uniref:Uncharacterized protein n=1 Tax=Euplotes crassus TaxID=5936 RepID=A0AAD1UD24_EUPCR|nr:unnamed protein product [Moneuplotes crassus]
MNNWKFIEEVAHEREFEQSGGKKQRTGKIKGVGKGLRRCVGAVGVFINTDY